MRSRVLLFAVPLLLAIAGPAFARGGGTLDSLLPEIRAQHPGRLSDAEPFTAQDGSTHYRIKWMTPDGRILYFDADARNGRYFDSGNNDVGRQWRRGGAGDDEDGGGSRWRGGGDTSAGGNDGDGSGRHRDWNGDGARGGDGGSWRNRDRGEGGDWRGGQGNWGNRGGDWRGGRGDNGGSHHHHGG